MSHIGPQGPEALAAPVEMAVMAIDQRIDADHDNSLLDFMAARPKAGELPAVTDVLSTEELDGIKVAEAEAVATVDVVVSNLLDARVNRRSFLRNTGKASGLVAFGGLAAACAPSELEKPTSKKKTAPTTSTSTTPETTTTTEVEVTPEQARDTFWSDLGTNVEMATPENPTGFDRAAGEVVAGTAVDVSKNVREAGSGSFNALMGGGDNHQLDNPEEISWFLADTSNERAVAVRQHIIEQLSDEPTELVRALTGFGYVPLQFPKTDIIVNGTSYYDELGKLVKMDGDRSAKAGDLYWIFAREDGSIVWEASLRADCVNPNIDRIRPLRPGEKRPPSISMKRDGSVDAAGVPDAPGASDTDTPSTDAGRGRSGQPADSGQYVEGEYHPPAQPEASTATDPNSNVGSPVPEAGVVTGPEGGNGSPVAPVESGNPGEAPAPFDPGKDKTTITVPNI